MKTLVLLLIFCTLNLATSTSKAYPVLWSVPSGGSVAINVFGVCRIVTNNVTPAAAITVNTYDSTLWNNYIASPPTGVSIGSCPVVSPIYIATANANGSGSTSCTVTKPTGLAAGDLMITTLYDTSNLSTVTAPSGFTLVHGPNQIGASSYWNTRHYKIASAGDAAAANFTYTKTTNFSDCGITMTVFRNVNQTTPIAGSAFNTGTGTTTVTYLSVTATTAGSVSFAISESTDISTPSVPTGYTNIADVSTQYLRLSMKVLSSSGATGNFDGTLGAPGTFATSHIVINPM